MGQNLAALRHSLPVKTFAHRGVGAPMDGLSALPWTARWCQSTLPCTLAPFVIPCRFVGLQARGFSWQIPPLRRPRKKIPNFYVRFQLDEPWLGVPGFCIGLRIIDGQVELDRVVIDATVTLDRAHLTNRIRVGNTSGHISSWDRSHLARLWGRIQVCW